MKTKSYILALLFTILSGMVMAQGGSVTHYLNATTNGTTLTMPADGLIIQDDNTGATGQYSVGHDWSITVTGSCTAPSFLSLSFNAFDVRSIDTVFIYDGRNTSSPLIIAANNDSNNLSFKTIYATASNTSNSLTIRFKTSSMTGQQAQGFTILVSCKVPCESLTPIIDSFYFKTRNGQIYETGYFKNLYDVDTVTGDTNFFKGVTLCLGDGVIFNAHCDYTHLTGHYNPNDSTTNFRWNFGNGDTLSGIGASQVACTRYFDIDCYDVVLNVEDERGCPATVFAIVQVRLAQNPIKTIFDLQTQCNYDSLLVNVGYEGENGTLTLRQISFEKMRSKTNAAKTFIPDGPNCLVTCYEAPVEFEEFPSGRTVTSKDDICSVCINFEHEFMGDYELSIICPSLQKAVFKYKNAPYANAPVGTYAGSGTYTGYPYGGSAHHTYDGSSGQATICDSVYNMYGVGLDYCFSRNGSYTLVDGEPASTQNLGSHYLANTDQYIDNVTYDFSNMPIPQPYNNAGQNAGVCSFSTKHPSNHEDKTDYYLPADDFSTLVGCPLNGIWSIEICDTWGQDNGWVFSWSLDICGVSSGNGCQYQVGLDSLVWLPDSNYGDWLTGKWRGVHVIKRDSVNSYISTPDTAGTFPINIFVYDEYGCAWDTVTRITTLWAPQPDLGADTILCSVESLKLDAKDVHDSICNYTYLWSPTGETTDTIIAHVQVDHPQEFVVEVTNTQLQRRCLGYDTILVKVNKQPVPNFDPGIYPLEGCEPFTINITNTTANGYSYFWDFGDGNTSTEMNPKHVYATGNYGFKYYVSSEDGCKDSLIYDQLVTVYPSPTAKFSWDPIYPTVMKPVVHFQNRSEPADRIDEYFWEIQYDKDNPNSFHTLTDTNPDFEWYTDGEDISGSYIVRLIARTDNLAPSGYILKCADTVENNILLVNDFLQFPNVVTPNGDGINDRFVIVNLVEGLGYPINQLDIYNKWGSRVYHKENISRDEDFWDPGASNMPAGTYYYRFSGKGYNGNIERNGVIEVLK